MDADSFNDLALRVLAREATDDERHALETELSSSTARRDEFEQLRITHDILRTVAPMAEASRAVEPELPAYRLNELRTAVRQHFGPAANRRNATVPGSSMLAGLRWIFAGGATTILAVVAVLLIFSDRSIEVGQYRSNLVRSGDETAPSGGIAPAHIVMFDQDATFDQWKKSLAWYQHGKVWVDDEKNLLHILQRDAQGNAVDRAEPLAATDQEQREQISQAVQSLKR